MAPPADSKPQISDPNFRRAVEMIDSGSIDALRAWLERHPQLLRESADEDGSFAGSYFAQPRLIWFVAENPIRNGRSPLNIADVTRVLIDAAREHAAEDLHEQLNTTLGLVCSGRVPRESGVQAALIDVLVNAGADPDSAIDTAIAHRETDACRKLLRCGAELTLISAAGLGSEAEVNRLKRDATEASMQAALAAAAINAESRAVRILVDNGADPNRYCPAGFGAHATPLHHAIDANSYGSVTALITRGADPALRDRNFNADARGWAEHMQRAEILALLDESRVFVPAIDAVRAGDTATLESWLREHPTLVDETLGDNPRTLLLYATDWPGHPPNVAETIELLVGAGADPNKRHAAPDSGVKETPLHWAASSNDVAACQALLDAGADIDPTGGCIVDGTPLVLAVLFENFAAAECLLRAGASYSLCYVAGMGRLDLVATYFDADGHFRDPNPPMPHRQERAEPQAELDSGLLLAAKGGWVHVVELLLDRGAALDAVSAFETTALDNASKAGHADVVELLKLRGGRTFAEL